VGRGGHFCLQIKVNGISPRVARGGWLVCMKIKFNGVSPRASRLLASDFWQRPQK